MTISPESLVGDLASQHPLATRVLARHGIDFCCGGGKPLGLACQKRGLDTPSIIAEIEDVLAAGPGTTAGWNIAPLDDLIDHIVGTYHRGLDEELPRLEAMLSKVHRVHEEKDPKRLRALLDVFRGLQAELTEHMQKEESILFPMIRSGQGRSASGPIAVMEHEHDAAGNALERIRALTDDYTPPADACATWRALWAGLAQLETDLHQHIHLENNILFPRAMGKAG